jgi:hypothetical protein
MSLYDSLMDFVFDETIKMLAGATNAPVPVRTYDGAGNVTSTQCPSVLPMDQPFGVSGLKNAHGSVVFYNVTYVDDPYNRQVETVLEPNADRSLTTLAIRSTRALRVFWACCGADGFVWADRLRLMLFDTAIRADFATKGMAIIPNVAEPVFAPEMIGQEWLHRYDLTATFYQEANLVKTSPAVDVTTIIIQSEQGVEAQCSVSQES